jgi:large subunit ribosomal protein L3
MARGSMQFWHRKRASRQLPRLRNYVESGAPSLSSLVAYKAGMIQLVIVDDSESPTKNQEIARAATVLEYPKTELYGVRFYKINPTTKYEETSTEVFDIEAAKRIGDAKPANGGKIADYKAKLGEFSDVSALLVAYPTSTSMARNHPDRFESRVSGKNIQEKFEFLAAHIGKEIKVNEIFKKGEDIDVVAVTKGKGWQGPIKRFGVSRLFHKATQKVRHVGTLGAFGPSKVFYTVPHAGQTGYHTRTDLNKKILEMGTKENAAKINRKGGFKNYGQVLNDYIVVDGSIPGPAKRLARLRKGVRNHQKAANIKEPKIIEIMTN